MSVSKRFNGGKFFFMCRLYDRLGLCQLIASQLLD